MIDQQSSFMIIKTNNGKEIVETRWYQDDALRDFKNSNVYRKQYTFDNGNIKFNISKITIRFVEGANGEEVYYPNIFLFMRENGEHSLISQDINLLLERL
jgi:hypothetical protein